MAWVFKGVVGAIGVEAEKLHTITSKRSGGNFKEDGMGSSGSSLWNWCTSPEISHDNLYKTSYMFYVFVRQ